MARTRTARRRRLRLDGGTLILIAIAALIVVDYLRTHPQIALALVAAGILVIVAWTAKLHQRITGRPRIPLRVSPLRLTPDQFEHYVAGLLAQCGMRGVEVSGGAGDLGADVVALDEHGRRIVAQCKRYGPRHAVGSADMQRFVGTARPHHRADVALFVTTSRFTRPALDYARQHNVTTIDGAALHTWQKTGRTPWT